MPPGVSIYVCGFSIYIGMKLYTHMCPKSPLFTKWSIANPKFPVELLIKGRWQYSPGLNIYFKMNILHHPKQTSDLFSSNLSHLGSPSVLGSVHLCLDFGIIGDGCIFMNGWKVLYLFLVHLLLGVCVQERWVYARIWCLIEEPVPNFLCTSNFQIVGQLIILKYLKLSLKLC